MNKSDMDYITNATDKQSRITEAKSFLDYFFRHVTGKHFGYLWLKRQGEKWSKTVSYPVTDEKARAKMAADAIQFSDDGFDVYFGVNLTDIPPKYGRRSVKVANEKNNAVVTVQVATVADIDIEGGNHISGAKNVGDEPIIYPPTFDDAKSLLPFKTSLIVDSGYGLHGYLIFADPLTITAENRDEAEERNKRFIESIWSRAGKYLHAVDSVHDLPRVLRMPGTRNYKTGISEEAPICHVAEFNNIRFSPAEIDEKLAALIPKKEAPTEKTEPTDTDKPRDFSHAENRGELSEGIRTLIDDINTNVTPEILIAKGYLEQSAHGDLCCPWCGSGHGQGQSGALHYYSEGANSHFTCFSTRQYADNHGGDVIALVAHVKNLPTRGKEFFDTLKVIADEFGIGYDPKIFEMKPKKKAPKLPIELTLPSGISFQGNSIKIDCGTEEKPKIVTAARTLILPIKKLVNDGGGNLRYEVAICSPQGKWTRAVVSKRTLLDPARIYELTEHDADVSNAKLLASYFSRILAVSDNDKLISIVTVFNRPGWHGDKFIYPTHAESDNYRVERAGIAYQEIFKASGDKDAWLSKFLEVTNGEQQALKRAVIGACLVAPMLKVIRIMNPQINVWGTSDFAKTPLIKFGLSIYGDPKDGALMRSWNATPKNMLTIAAGFNDLPLFVDEGETMTRRTKEALSEFIYNFSIGIIGQANKRNGDVRATEKFNCARLSTAEHPLHDISDKRGSFKRLIDLHVTKALFDDDYARALHIFCENNHGHYGRRWTRYIAEHKDEIAHDFNRTNEYFAVTGFVRDGLHAELKSVDATNARSIIAFFVAYYHFCKCLGVNEEYGLAHAAMDAAEILAQLPTVTELNELQRSIGLLASWVAEHPRNFITPRKHEDGSPIEGVDNPAESYTETVGKKFADGSIAFFANAFRKICEKIGVSSYEKFLGDLYEADYLDCKSNREKCKMIKVDGKSVRAYVIAHGLFDSDDD